MSPAPPVRIGISTTLIGLSSTALSLAHAAHMRGAEIFFFKPEDIDPADESIDAHFFHKGGWERRRTKFPDVVDNDTMEDPTSEAWQALVRKCRITTPDLGGKLAVQEAMRASGKFEQLLIATAKLESPDQLLDELGRHKRVVVKPELGLQGRGVFYVARKNGRYFVNADGISQDLGLPDLNAFVAARLAKDSLIVQEYVASRTVHGLPYDIRIHVRRDHNSDWQTVYINARIGSGTSIAANLATGGSLAKIGPFLKRQFGAAAEQVERRISAVAKHFPPTFQALFPDRTIPTLGIDVGVDEKGRPRFFEVNSYPSAQFAPFNDHMWRVGYAIYLVENPGAPDGVVRGD